MEKEKVFDLTVQGISPSEVVKLETLFKLLAEETGGINEEQLADLMPRMGAFYSEEELHTLFRSVDIDNSGEIDFHEFLMLIARHREESQLALLEGGRECFEHLLRATTLKYVMRSDDLVSGVMDVLVLLSILFYTAVVLYEDVLWDDLPNSKPVKIIGAVYMIVDVIRGFFTAVTPKESDTLPADSRQTCRKQYLHSWRFIIDIVSALPFDIIFLLTGMNTLHRIFQNLRVIKFLTLPNLFRLTPRDVLSPIYAKFYFVFVPLLKMCFWACISVHTLTMIWIVLTKNAAETVDEGIQVASYRYIDSVYFVVYTITTTGYGTVPVVTRWQKYFSIILFVCASIVTGLVVGKLVQFSQQADLKADSARRMLETIAALDHLTIPRDFKEEVLAFQLHLLKHSNSLFNDAIAGLPQCMQDRMALYARMKIVRKVPIFLQAPEICVAKLAQSLVTVFVSPEEYIVIAGEEGEEMFFLFHGMCCVTLANGKWVATIKRGGVFGEKALLEATRRSASIKSLTYCQLFRLDKTAFMIIVQLFPQLMDSVIAVANQHCTARQPEKNDNDKGPKSEGDDPPGKPDANADAEKRTDNVENAGTTDTKEGTESTDGSSGPANGNNGSDAKEPSSPGLSDEKSDVELFKSSILGMNMLGSSIRSSHASPPIRRKRGSVTSTLLSKRGALPPGKSIGTSAAHSTTSSLDLVDKSRRLSFPDDNTATANVILSRLEHLSAEMRKLQAAKSASPARVCGSSTPILNVSPSAVPGTLITSVQRASLPPMPPIPPGVPVPDHDKG